MIRLAHLPRCHSLLLRCLLGGFAINGNWGAASDQIIPSDQVVAALAQFESIRNEIRGRVSKGEFAAFAVGALTRAPAH